MSKGGHSSRVEAAWAGRSGRTRIDGHGPKPLDLGLTLVSSSRAGLQFRPGLGLSLVECRGKLILQEAPEVVTG